MRVPLFRGYSWSAHKPSVELNAVVAGARARPGDGMDRGRRGVVVALWQEFVAHIRRPRAEAAYRCSASARYANMRCKGSMAH
jgi:hypothetical protein